MQIRVLSQLVVAVLAVTPLVATEPGTPREILQRHMAGRDSPSEMTLISARRIALADGEFVDHGEFLSADRRRVEKLLLLGSTGEALTIDELHRRQQSAWEARHGKLSPRLVQALAAPGRSASPHRLVVSVWTETPVGRRKPVGFDSQEQVRAWRERMRDDRVRQLRSQRTRLGEVIVAMGGAVHEELDGMPILEVAIPVDRIAELAARPEIGRIDLPFTEDESGPTHAAMWFWDADDSESLESYAWQGLHGNGINVGVYEWANYCGLWHENNTTPAGFSGWGTYALSNGGPAIHGCDQPGVNDGDPCNVACNNGPGFCRGGACMKEHVTMVASKLGSVRDGEHRNASEMNLYYANVGGRDVRMNWLAGQGVTIVNDSEDATNDAPVNWSIRNDFISLTKSVGNSQGVAVNCFDNGICVGSYSIVDVANIDAWKADPLNSAGLYQLSGSTAFIDDAGRWDAEKPDVMGNGEYTLPSPMVTPRTGEWAGASGTSFAAPMVGGLVALLQEHFPTAQAWPELVRPMLQVSAVSHNLLGASLSRNGGPDEIDGAGIPTASTLKEIVDDGTFATMTLTPSVFDAAGQYTPVGAQVTLQPYQTVRAALGWMYCVESGVTMLATDLDLKLVEVSNGSLADWSLSYTNSLEMVQYTNDTGQPRTFDLKVQRVSQSPCEGQELEYAGLAWTVVGDNMGPSRLYPVTKTADTSDLACDDDCSLREAVARANATPGLDLITLENTSYALSLAGTLEDANLVGDLDVTDDLIVRGKGRLQSVVSAGNLDRVFHVLGGAELQLEGLTLTLGNPSGPGGALAVEDGAATLTDVLLFLNQGTQGGAIWSDNSELSLDRCDLLSNTATADGGAIYVAGGGLDLFDSEVSGNVAGNGGGLYNANGSVLVAGVAFWNNSATVGKGGAVRNFGSLQLSATTLSDNSATLEGGAVWNALGQTVYLDHSTLATNSAPSGSALWSQGSLWADGSMIDGDCAGGGTLTAASGMIESPGNTCGFSPSNNRSDVAELRLAELSFYGGPTRTRPPLPDSPAVDPYFWTSSGPTDQRGIPRPLDGGTGFQVPDVGAAERVHIEISMTSTSLVQWNASSVANSYRVYRGVISQLIDTDQNGRSDPGYGQCMNGLDSDPQDTQFVDALAPPSGDGWFYLVEPETDVGPIGVGWSDAGLKRNPAVACPAN